MKAPDVWRERRTLAEALKQKHPIGRRGACLMSIGYLEFVYGLAMVAEPLFRVRPGIDVITTFIPGLALGIMWVVFGAMTIIGGLLPTGFDRHGFRAALPMPMLWGMNYVISVALGQYASGWVSGLAVASIWFGYVFIVLTASGMIGVEDLRERERK